MKHSLLLVLFIPLTVFGQWNFSVVDNGQTQSEAALLFPVEYNTSSCEFSFSVVDEGTFSDVVIENQNECTSLNHFIVIDGYKYSLPLGFELDMFSDQWNFYSFIDLGACSRFSGGPVNNASPYLFVGGNFIQIDTSQSLNFYNSNGNTYFNFNTSDGDVICVGGVPIDLIFKGVFE